jgi:hypothetical protein
MLRDLATCERSRARGVFVPSPGYAGRKNAAPAGRPNKRAGWVRKGKYEEARRKLAREFTGNIVGEPRLLKACLDRRPRQVVEALAQRMETQLGVPARDAEELYLLAAVESFCDLQSAAIRLAQRMVAENYCAVDGLSRDPLFDRLRARAEYPAILKQAGACRDRFVAESGR